MRVYVRTRYVYREAEAQIGENRKEARMCSPLGKGGGITMKMKMIDQIVQCVIWTAVGMIISCESLVHII